MIALYSLDQAPLKIARMYLPDKSTLHVWKTYRMDKSFYFSFFGSLKTFNAQNWAFGIAKDEISFIIYRKIQIHIKITPTIQTYVVWYKWLLEFSTRYRRQWSEFLPRKDPKIGQWPLVQTFLPFLTKNKIAKIIWIHFLLCISLQIA